VTVSIRKFRIIALVSNRMNTEVTIWFEISNIRTALIRYDLSLSGCMKTAQCGTGMSYRCCSCCSCCCCWWLAEPDRCLRIMFSIALRCSIASVFSYVYALMSRSSCTDTQRLQSLNHTLGSHWSTTYGCNRASQSKWWCSLCDPSEV